MGRRRVVLVAMPWEDLEFPSIQLGVLQAVLEAAGIETVVRSLKLAFMEYCGQASAAGPEDERLTVRDYKTIVEWSRDVSLGDWIFAVPPFRDAAAGDHAYLAFLRDWPVPEPDIALALRFRALVPGFLAGALEEILDLAPALVGFTTAFNQSVASLVLAKLLKARAPTVPIVFGGANCQGAMGAALHRAFSWIDVVVRGEGETTLPTLVTALFAGAPVPALPGFCYREDGRSVAVDEGGAPPIPMDAVPTPTYDEYFAQLARTSFQAELVPEVTLFYESARGCWWGAKSPCTFCGISPLLMPFRSKSPARVVAELIALAERYRQLRFLVVDYIMDHRYLQEVLPALRDTGYDFRIFWESKANLKKAQVRLLREAGVESIQAGVESLSTPILRQIRKGVTAFQNIRLIKWASLFGVRLFWNVLYGFPGEPPDEYTRMAAVVPSLMHLQPPRLVRLSLDRFSPYHARPEAFGLELVGPREDYRFLFPVDAATLSDLAYSFTYRHADGREPDTYAAPLRRAVETWRASWLAGVGSLTYRRGPGFLTISDRRPTLPAGEYQLDEREATLYLACEDGATAAEAWGALSAADQEAVTPEEVRAFLDELVVSRLVYAEDGRYLALALPGNPVRGGAVPARSAATDAVAGRALAGLPLGA